MAPVPSKTSITRGAPSSRTSGLVGPHTTPRDSQLRALYDIYTTRRVLLAAHAPDVNILIWTSRKSVDMKQMIASWSMVMVHALMAAGLVNTCPIKRDIGVSGWPSRLEPSIKR